jgi:hypothetical protein
MEFSSRLSLYDFLAILLPGMLFTNCLYGCLEGVFFYSSSLVPISIYFIISYFVGIINNTVSECLTEKNRNNINDIRNSYKKIYNDNNAYYINKKDYYKAYYHLMQTNNLNNIPILEIQYAFLRNAILVIIFMNLTILYDLIINNNSFIVFSFSEKIELLIFNHIILLLIPCIEKRKKLKIMELVWEGDFYCNKETTTKGI